MVRPFRHRQTKEAETDTPDLTFTAPHSYSTASSLPSSGGLRLRLQSVLRAQKTEGVFPMVDARCSCGALTLTLPEPSRLVVACHCLDCQRRTGAPFGVGAFYPAEVVAISGTPKRFTRDAASGGKVHPHNLTAIKIPFQFWRAERGAPRPTARKADLP
jgi:glutathione-dependent formaldehyde-activating enzyme